MTRLRQRQFATASLLSCDVCVFRPQNGWLAGKKILFHLFAVFPIPFQDLIDVKQQVEDKVPAPLLSIPSRAARGIGSSELNVEELGGQKSFRLRRGNVSHSRKKS